MLWSLMHLQVGHLGAINSGVIHAGVYCSVLIALIGMHAQDVPVESSVIEEGNFQWPNKCLGGRAYDGMDFRESEKEGGEQGHI